MWRFPRSSGRKMTTVIAALVISSIILSVGVVSGTIFLTLREQAVEQGRVQQETNLRVAATVLERSLLGARLIWSDANEMLAFRVFVFPTITDDVAINAVTSITGQQASVLQLDPDTQTFVAKTASLSGMDDEVSFESITIDANSAVGQALLEGETYFGETTLLGTRYYGAILPISNLREEVLGAIHVMTPTSQIEARANAALTPIVLAGGAAIIVMGLVGLLVSRRITQPIPRLASVTRKIADGEHDTEVPYTLDQNEIGEMARAVEVLRESAKRVSQLTEAEAARILADEEKRAQMMAELQAAFGVVVDAALDGDFSRRVDTQFSDKELNALASGINELVDGFGRGMDELVRVLSVMAQADLTERMTGAHRGAFAQLKENVNSLADKFSEVVGELKSASASLKDATGEILSGANDLSARTTRQAETIMEASASMDRLAEMVVRNTQRANEASQNASTVTEAATKSGETMLAADQAMERIRSSSDKISNIIGLIDDIAFQTNLLALNASVEAARAGDAGKGFAVVAVEVRRLAQSAAQASSEVKTLVEQAATEVSAGSRLVDQATKCLETMRAAAHSNQTLLDAIAHDSQEQATSIEGVNTAVRHLEEMTQHNAGLVEETNAAIEQTGEQAAALDAIVSVFSVSEQRSADSASADLPGERVAA